MYGHCKVVNVVDFIYCAFARMPGYRRRFKYLLLCALSYEWRLIS